MPYPEPSYRTATILTSVAIATAYVTLLQNITKGAGYGGLTVEANIAYMLGFAIRQGLPQLDPGAVGAAYVDRFDARYGSATTTMNAYLFADDVTLATNTATSTGRTLAKVYRTSGLVGLAMRNWSSGGNQFFVPVL